MCSQTGSPGPCSHVRVTDARSRFDVHVLPLGERMACHVGSRPRGRLLLPAGTPIFRGRSLGSVEDKVSFYLSGLELRGMGDVIRLRIRSASRPPPPVECRVHDAIRQAEVAEGRRVRLASWAIEELSDTGFSIRDIMVLVGRIQEQPFSGDLGDGRLIRELQRIRFAAKASSLLASEDLVDFGARVLGWYSFRHADAGLSPGAAIALEIGLEVMPESEETSRYETFFPGATTA